MQIPDMFYNIKLSMVGILSIIFTTFGLMATVLMIASQYRLTYLAKESKDENDNAIAIKINPKTIHKLEKQITIFMWIAAIGLLAAMLSIGVFIKYNTTAKKYGAYEHVQWSQSLKQIKECEQYGYIESTDIPDDLRGCIVIYFKYGCPDCRDIHDHIMKYLKDNPVEKLYFVSSRSTKGKELIQKYPVNEVPSGIYIRQKESQISDIYWEVLYTRLDEKDGEPAIFNQKGLEFLIDRQNEGE